MAELSDAIIGIDPAAKAKLGAAGMTTLDELREVNIYSLTGQVNISIKSLRNWQQMPCSSVFPVSTSSLPKFLLKVPSPILTLLQILKPRSSLTSLKLGQGRGENYSTASKRGPGPFMAEVCQGISMQV